MKPLPASQQLKLVSQVCDLQADHAALTALTTYGKALRAAAKGDPGLEPLQLSTRQLLCLGRRLKQRPEDLPGLARAALTAYVHFLPPLSKQAVLRMMKEAMQSRSSDMVRWAMMGRTAEVWGL